jgi:site-specific recombinase XerD
VRADVTSSPEFVPNLSPEPWIIDAFMADPWDPFDGRAAELDPELLPEEALTDPNLTVGVFTLAALMLEPDIRGNIMRGLRDLNDDFRDLPLKQATRRRVSTAEDRVRQLAIEAAQSRLEQAQREPDPVRRASRVQRAEVSLSRRGASRWHDYLAAVAWLSRFARDVGVLAAELPDRPTRALHAILEESEERRALEEHEIHLIWDAAAAGSDPELALLVLDFVRETAARRQAVIDLTLDDIRWDDSYVVLHTKYRRRVPIPVSRDLLERIAVRNAALGWDGQYRTPTGEWVANPSRAAFKRENGTAITARYFDKLFDRVERAVGGKLGDRVTAHWLRHTTLTQVDRIAGRDVAAGWAGHRAGGTGAEAGNATAHYTRFSIDELKALHARMFPDTPPGGIDPAALCAKFVWLRENPDG